MAQRTGRGNGSANSLESALENIEREFERVQRRFRSQRREVGKRIERGRRQLETRGRKQVRSLIADVRKSDAYKRAQALRKDAEKQIESGVESVLALLQVASRRDLERVDRKLRTLTKKLSELEKPAAASVERRTAV